MIGQDLELSGPAFSGVSVCGEGIDETQLSGGELVVSDTGGGAPFCLEGVTVTNPNGNGLSIYSTNSPCSVRMTSCAITDCKGNGAPSGVLAFGGRTSL